MAFALDDFGTGCSVLSYLKHFPVSYIKMDRSFTQDILSEKTSRHIVESVVGLAGKLGIDTVAEGVETELSVLSGSGLSAGVLFRQTGKSGYILFLINDVLASHFSDSGSVFLLTSRSFCFYSFNYVCIERQACLFTLTADRGEIFW
nr:EAL domain-containing protein [Escherichia coli]